MSHKRKVKCLELDRTGSVKSCSNTHQYSDDTTHISSVLIHIITDSCLRTIFHIQAATFRNIKLKSAQIQKIIVFTVSSVLLYFQYFFCSKRMPDKKSFLPNSVLELTPFQTIVLCYMKHNGKCLL